MKTKVADVIFDDSGCMDELYDLDYVWCVTENHHIVDKNHKDADFEIEVGEDYKIEKIEKILNRFGYTAYVLYEDQSIKAGAWHQR